MQYNLDLPISYIFPVFIPISLRSKKKPILDDYSNFLQLL
ncbi:hypothetical protein DSUL_50091 [Desulfovibrionales bacterium]